MSNISDQIEEIKISISSNTNKSLAYSTLSYLQEQSTNNPDSIQTIADTTPTLSSLMVADIHDPLEEIAVQALKCLGFMMYHQSLVSALSVDGANLVLDSLVKLITTTKIKSVCNLGVWCISVQQFSETIIASHFDSLLQAVVHGLDNPFGSLSTTFEASQAVMKLGTQSGEKMRNSSHIWVPPLYRRLLSSDKRERDMSDRCLLKIVSLIIPPPLNLSKALVKDMRQTLLIGMKDLLNPGTKIHVVRAWGWFIKFLGSYALKNRNLINEMLKIPEHTFSNHDPQLQIASLVAWEGLIDALIFPAILPHKRNAAEEDEKMGIYKKENDEIQANGYLKSAKLIMRPLLGVMLGKCDASVYGSCFNTWCYLLYKLDSSINCSLVKELVLKPMFEAVFQMGPNCKSIWLWNQVIDLLDGSIFAKSIEMDKEASKTPFHEASKSGKCSQQKYPIKWVPWEFGDLDFYLKLIYVLLNQMSKAELTHEERSLVNDASLRLFRSVLKGVEMILKKETTSFNVILSCLKTLLKFVHNLWEEHCEGSDHKTWCDVSLELVRVLIEEIEPSILDSPLYKMALDFKHIVKSQSAVDETRHAKIFEMCSFDYMDMVSPIVYLTALCFSMVSQSTFNASNSDFLAQKYWKILLSSYDPSDSFIVTVRLLYNDMGPSCLRLWIAIAKGLIDCTDELKSMLSFKSRDAYFATCYLLCYPFVICYRHQKNLEDSRVSVPQKLEFEQFIVLWKSLYGLLCNSKLESLTANDFSEDLCDFLDSWLDKYCKVFESTNKLELNSEDLNLDHVSVYGGVVTCILEESQSSESRKVAKCSNSSGFEIMTGVNNCLTLAIRFMKLLQTISGNGLPTDSDVASRFYTALAQFISCLHLKKQDTLSFLKIISSPLFQWLTQIEALDKSSVHQFQLLWEETLNCLLWRSQPPIVFNSALLELQSPLLEKTLDHPNPAISKPTMSFWNSTYGDQIKLDYPQNLLQVLDKLSRNGKIKLHKRTTPFLGKCNSGSRANANSEANEGPEKVGLLKGIMNHPKHKNMPSLNIKRKTLELTEHQKEVRRAQRGRDRDCEGHGLGGIRTYTNLDFSQGNEDSQDSQEIWNLESVLDKLK